MNCLFCKLANGEIPADIVFQDDSVIAFRDISPQAPVHMLIIPRKHIPGANSLTDAHAEVLGRMFAVAREIAADEGIAETGHRLVINSNEDGGQTVFHLHMHLLGGRRMAWPPG